MHLEGLVARSVQEGDAFPVQLWPRALQVLVCLVRRASIPHRHERRPPLHIEALLARSHGIRIRLLLHEVGREGTDILGDPARLSGGHLGATERIQQGRLSVVDVPQHGYHGNGSLERPGMNSVAIRIDIPVWLHVHHPRFESEPLRRNGGQMVRHQDVALGRSLKLAALPVLPEILGHLLPHAQQLQDAVIVEAKDDSELRGRDERRKK
mmetsp:Transcript_20643/g.45249  ORF Transcript_20643/g.45249 Transcript_20643/m.45249 type:complete len:210 (+) Transcript_20643:2129-2758(+)